MTSSKIKELIFDKFVYKATILLLGIWVITLLNEETTLLESAKTPLKNTTIGLPKNSDENLNPKKIIQEPIQDLLSLEEKELISEVLTNSFKESKEANSDNLIKEPETSKPSELLNEEENKLLEIIETGKALRDKGKTLESLKTFREATFLFPKKSILIWELHLTYELMSLHEKSRGELDKIISMGKAEGGEYWEMSKLKMLEDGVDEKEKSRQKFLFGKVIESIPRNQKNEQTVFIKMEIKSTLDGAIDVKDVTLIVDFYDIVNGSDIQPTSSEQPSPNWKTNPVDWKSANSEIVEWKYYLPDFSMTEQTSHGGKEYYGFVARLYYKDLLTDIYANPRILLEPKQRLKSLFLDSSLFPPENN